MMRSFFLALTLLIVSSNLITSLPLSTSSRWIVDESGRRVKLACVNWVSHLEPMVAEGLGKQPLDTISKSIVNMGFNCVRFTWPVYLATNDSLASMTVRQSLRSLGLDETIEGFNVNNPTFLDLPLIVAYKTVVSNLADNNIMVILDNHISKPGWCCGRLDGNGFFGDRYFDPELWIKGLTRMATLFNGSSNVVGMSLRNELRGPNQTIAGWYSYMQRGAEAVHSANSNVLVILSGLNFDTNLSHLHNKQVKLSFASKLVFELHWYAFSNGQAWVDGNPNDVCGSIRASVMQSGGFLLDQGWPLFLSEFGGDQRGINVNDNRYFGCILAVMAELDLDWALWTLQGSYYLKQGGTDETYGILAWDWCKQRNSIFLQRIATLQSPFQGPGLSDDSPHILIFHPSTGQCVQLKSFIEPELQLGPCDESEGWTYTSKRTLALKGTVICLKADDDGEPAELQFICSDSCSKWELISDSKLHVSTKLTGNSSSLCLDVGSDGSSIVTNACKCLSKDNSCDPESQWFKFVNSTRGTVNDNSMMRGVLKRKSWNSHRSYSVHI